MGKISFYRRKCHRRIIISCVLLFVLLLILRSLYSLKVHSGSRYESIFTSDENYLDYDVIVEDEIENYIPKHHDQQAVEIELANNAVDFIGNLPDTKFLLGQHFSSWKWKTVKCARFPDLYRILFSNLYWQVQQIENATYYLYKAYYDNRQLSQVQPSVVRILAMVDQLQLPSIPVCQFWFLQKSVPVISKVTVQRSIWNNAWSKKGLYLGFILTCPIPNSTLPEIPHSVSLVSKDCDDATNHLRVIQNGNKDNEIRSDESPDKKAKTFGVCVKGLDLIHEDKSVRLIEWIELLLALGADKIFFYEFALHPNVKTVLDYYVKEGKIDVTTITWPGYLPNEPKLRHLFMSHKDHLTDKRKNELITYNDCLLKNYNKYDYLTMLDTDEVIIPKRNTTWKNLLEDLETDFNDVQIQNKTKKIITSYCFRNVYFFDAIPPEEKLRIETKFGIPSHLHMLQHLYRSSSYTPPRKYVKCFHKTELTSLVHNHFPMSCFGLRSRCNVHNVDVELAQLQHYRTTCVKDLKNCKEYEQSSVLDTHILEHKDKIIQNVAKTLGNIHLI